MTLSSRSVSLVDSTEELGSKRSGSVSGFRGSPPSKRRKQEIGGGLLSPQRLLTNQQPNSGAFGAAYFDPIDSTLYLAEDTTESYHFDLSRMRKRSYTDELLIL
jgi:hypothetical protein